MPPGEQATVSRVRENRMHGSMGGGRRPTSVGHAARRQAPPAYPTQTLDTPTEARLQPALETLEIERRFVAHVSDNLDRPGSLRPTRTGRSRVRARGGASRRLN